MCDTVYDRPHECVSVGKPLETKMDTSNKNLGDTKKGYAVTKDSVLAREIWNEAIEAAAKHVDSKSDYPSYCGENIRKLKK